MNKSEIVRNLIFAGISLGELYVLYGKKYLNPFTFLALYTSYELGKQIHISMQENNAGGSTPYNPLKIPAKNITPAH